MKYLFIVVSLVLAAPVFALAQVTVAKVSVNPPAVGLSAVNAVVKVGEVFDAKTSKGGTCILTVSKVSQAIIMADTDCSGLADLPVGTVATTHVNTADDEWAKEVAKKQVVVVQAAPLSSPIVAPSAAAVVTPEPQDTNHQFGIGVYYSLANSLEAEGSIQGLKYTGTTKTDSGAGISFYYNNVKPNAFGSYVTLDHEFARKGGDSSLNIGGSTYVGDDSSSYGMTLLASNFGIGVSDAAIIYLGINVPLLVNVTDDPASDYYGKVGYQVGAMFKASSQVDLGFEYRAVNIYMKYNDGSSTGTGNISFDGALMRFGYRF